MTESEALNAAIVQAGSQVALAATVSTTQQAVSYWVSRGRVTSASLVLKIEEKTGVSRHDLRPDLYPRESGATDRDAA